MIIKEIPIKIIKELNKNFKNFQSKNLTELHPKNFSAVEV
jgi:hypothetical protein